MVSYSCCEVHESHRESFRLTSVLIRTSFPVLSKAVLAMWVVPGSGKNCSGNNGKVQFLLWNSSALDPWENWDISGSMLQLQGCQAPNFTPKKRSNASGFTYSKRRNEFTHNLVLVLPDILAQPIHLFCSHSMWDGSKGIEWPNAKVQRIPEKPISIKDSCLWRNKTVLTYTKPTCALQITG